MDYNLNNGIDALERIKLLMKYSLDKTLSENVGVTNKVVNEQTGYEMYLDKRDANPEKYDDGSSREKTTITIPRLNPKAVSGLTVVEGTVAVPFTGNETSGSMFPNLKQDQYGWYDIVNNKKIYYPKDEFWKTLPFIGGTKTFTTGPTETYPQGEKYHAILFLADDYSDYATIGPLTPKDPRKDIDSRGWNFYPGYFKTEGGQQVPYSEKNIDLRSASQAFWDEYGFWIQIGGSLLLAVATMGVGSVVAAGVLAEAGVAVGAAELAGDAILAGEAIDATLVGAEGLSLATEVETAVNAINIGKKYQFAADFITQGLWNSSFGAYQISRGQDTDATISFIFALLPVIHNLPGISRFLGKTIQYSDETAKEVSEVFGKFGGGANQEEVVKNLSKKGQELFKDVTGQISKNPKEFEEILKSAYKPAIKQAASKKMTAKIANFVVKTVEKSPETLKKTPGALLKFGKQLVVDMSAIELAKYIQEVYKEKYGQPMPKDEADKLDQMTEPTDLPYLQKYLSDLELRKATIENQGAMIQQQSSKLSTSTAYKKDYSMSAFDEYRNKLKSSKTPTQTPVTPTQTETPPESSTPNPNDLGG
jgi:hypothetical protein